MRPQPARPAQSTVDEPALGADRALTPAQARCDTELSQMRPGCAAGLVRGVLTLASNCQGHRRTSMNITKIVALVFIVGGALMLGYGGFSYTRENTVVKLGPIELSAKE